MLELSTCVENCSEVMPKPWHISSWLYASGCSTSSTRASISSKEAFSSVWTWANFNNLLESSPRARARNWVNTGVTQLKPSNRAEKKWLVFLYLCSNSAFHHADVVVRRCSFVHLHAAVGDHKHSPIRELDVGGSQGMEFDQLCLADKHPKREKMCESSQDRLLSPLSWAVGGLQDRSTPGGSAGLCVRHTFPRSARKEMDWSMPPPSVPM